MGAQQTPYYKALDSLKNSAAKNPLLINKSFCSTLITMSFSIDCVVGHVFPLTYIKVCYSLCCNQSYSAAYAIRSHHLSKQVTAVFIRLSPRRQ